MVANICIFKKKLDGKLLEWRRDFFKNRDANSNKRVAISVEPGSK